MKRLYLALLFLAFGLMAQAQNISVADFYLAENDLTARYHGTSMEDQNGNLCAIIKVETTEKGLWYFDVGALGVTKTEFQNATHPAEIWVWVPFGVTWVSIQHDKLGKLSRYNFPCSIDKGFTYIMKLTTGKVKTYIEAETTEQWLVFDITPHDAILEVDDKMWPVSAEGTARSMMPFGIYTYRVQAQNYYPTVGKVTVNDPENSQVVLVNLKPNFGWIEVPSGNGLAGAAVYVDNALVGKAPCKTEALKSGQHNVRILKELYEPYTATVTVNDNETTSVAPPLTADFAHLTLQVDADAEIWVNDERKGTRTWTGELRTGTYRIECKQKGHEATTTKITVTNSMNGETIHLESPIPIYGSLNVECTPDLATLYVDGKEMGKAPKLIGKILVGEHELRLSKDGYADYTETVTITQGERAQVKATLSNSIEIRFTCNVPDAQLEIDGQKIGTATGIYQLAYGSHRLQASASGYLDYNTTLSVTESSSRSHSIQMQSVLELEEEEVVELEVFNIVEEMPSFPGDEREMYEYLSKNIKYPKLAQECGITGRVFVKFVVEPDGSISNVKVIRGIGGGCDEEAMRVVETMPKWNPGKQRGKAVRVSYVLPLVFKLEDK